MFKRFIASLVCLTFVFSNLQYVQAQDFSVNHLPVPGTMVGESVPFSPLTLKGLIVNLQKPLEFQFIVDTGKGPQDRASIKEEANQLIKYFLAGLTIPEGDLWVNLSPYEKNRMVPEALGQTDLGRDLLAQDYILKQLTASLIYPEKDLGKEFWSRVYAKAQKQFGTTNIPVNTFNKVWILPDQAQVYENGNAAYVTQSTLKVMLDEDYLAMHKHMTVRNGTDSIGSQIVREIVIPEITKEINTGKNFAPLRQIYQALILAKWYKETIQNGLLDALYTNKSKVAGVNLDDPSVKEQIYNRYLQAYKKGAFNFIKEDPTPEGQVVPRKYFSGGARMVIHVEETHNSSAMLAKGWAAGALLLLNLVLGPLTSPVSAEEGNTSAQTPSAQTQPTSIKKLSEEEFQKLLEDVHNWNSFKPETGPILESALDKLAESGDIRAINPLVRFGRTYEAYLLTKDPKDIQYREAIEALHDYLAPYGGSDYRTDGEIQAKNSAIKILVSSEFNRKRAIEFVKEDMPHGISQHTYTYPETIPPNVMERYDEVLNQLGVGWWERKRLTNLGLWMFAGFGVMAGAAIGVVAGLAGAVKAWELIRKKRVGETDSDKSQTPHAAMTVSDLQQEVLVPSQLHENLLKAMKKRQSPVRIRHLMPKTLAPYGQKLNDGFLNVNEKFPTEVSSFVREKGQDTNQFLGRTSGDYDVTLLEVHGSENADDEEALIRQVSENKKPNEKLAVLIHRPEEFILRFADRHNLSVDAAKPRLKELLGSADAIILLLQSAISDLGYKEIFPGKVIAIPHGAFAAKPLIKDDNRYRPDSIVVIGSNTTWGEMRDIKDVGAVNDLINGRIKAFGYVAGSFDKRVNLDEYRSKSNFLFLDNEQIRKAKNTEDGFKDEQSFRQWLYNQAQGRVIVRAEKNNAPSSLKGIDDEIFEWEDRIIDFNMQMYHENPDLRYLRPQGQQDAPKVEASGTRHSGKSWEIMVLGESNSTRNDLGVNEGYRDVLVPYEPGQTGEGKYSFESAADRIVGLVQNPTERIAMMQNNARVNDTLGMQEIAFAHNEVMDFLINQHSAMTVGQGASNAMVSERVTGGNAKIRRLFEMKQRGEKFTMLTVYDETDMRLVEEGGVDISFVGDSYGMTRLGFSSTTFVTMDHMIEAIHAARGAHRHTLFVGDMPHESYLNEADAIKNARRLIDAGVEVVKLEGGKDFAPIVKALVDAGIPVMGHIGFTPQTKHGHKIEGRTFEEAQGLLDDALALEHAGAFAVVIELADQKVAGWISKRILIPTIGIGAGPLCDAQVLVIDDLLAGLGQNRTNFADAQKYLRGAPKMIGTWPNTEDGEIGRIREFVHKVKNGLFPDAASSFDKYQGPELLPSNAMTTNPGANAPHQILSPKNAAMLSLSSLSALLALPVSQIKLTEWHQSLSTGGQTSLWAVGAAATISGLIGAAVYNKSKIQFAAWELMGSVDAIVALLGNSDMKVRKAAMDAVDKKAVTPDKKLTILRKAVALRSPDLSDVRLWAMGGIDKLKLAPERKLVVLQRSLNNPNLDVQLWATREITEARVAPEEKLLVLRRSLKHPNSDVQVWAMREIDELTVEPEKKVEIFKELVDPYKNISSENVLIWAMNNINRMVTNPESKLTILRKCLIHHIADVRVWAMNEIGRLEVPPEKIIPVIMEELKREDRFVKGDVVLWAMQLTDKLAIDPQKKIPIFKRALTRPFSNVWAMNNIDVLVVNSEKKLLILQDAFGPFDNVNLWAMREIDKIASTPERKVAIYQKVLQYHNKNLHLWAMNNIDSLNLDMKLPILEHTLSIYHDHDVHLWAFHGLSQLLDGEHVVEFLLNILRGRYKFSNDVRFIAAEDLKEFGYKITFRPAVWGEESVNDGLSGSPISQNYLKHDEVLIIETPSRAMLHSEPKQADKAGLAVRDLGGIDLNQINVSRHGKTVKVQFDPAQLTQIMQGGFKGFSFKIESMVPISSPFQLLGIKEPAKPELLARA